MAVHDPDAAEEEVARATGARKAASGEDIVAAPDVDAVVIATPTDRHAAGIEAAARAGKAIFCEEPIDLDPDRARGLHRGRARDRGAADGGPQPPLRPRLR